VTDIRPAPAVLGVPTDDEGYLVDPQDWSEAVAAALAEREGLQLTDLHWQVLRFMRAFLDEHQLIGGCALRDPLSRRRRRTGRRCTPAALRALSLRLRQAGLQDRRHAAPARLEYGLTVRRALA